jgi:hypothetical protein
MTRERPTPPPRPPWHPFPLTELVVLVAVGCALGAVLTFGSARAWWFGAASLVLGTLAGMEIAVREHLSGYRSHAAALGGLAGCAVSVAGFLEAASPAELLGSSAGVFVVVAGGLQLQFRRRRRRAAAAAMNSGPAGGLMRRSP